MKRWLKAYALYLAGALAVIGYVLWVSRGEQGGGLDLSGLIASRNGHVEQPDEQLV